MRDEQADVLRLEAGLADRLERRRRERLRREPVRLLALHPDVVLAARDRLGRGRALRAAGGQPDHVRALGLGGELDAERAAGLVAGRQDRRARAVAEQDAGRSIGVVEEAGEQLRADHQDVLREPGLDPGLGGREPVDEARARRRDVHRRRARVADRLLDEGRGRGHPVVGRERREEDEVDLVRVDARGVDRPQAGDRAHRRGGLVRRGDPPLADAGPADDPLVVRVDHPLEVLVASGPGSGRSGPSR